MRYLDWNQGNCFPENVTGGYLISFILNLPPKITRERKKKLIAQFISDLFTLLSCNKERCINLKIAGCHRLTSWEANKWKEETNFHSSIQSIFPWEHKLRKGICMIASVDFFTFEEAGLFRPKLSKLRTENTELKGRTEISDPIRLDRGLQGSLGKRSVVFFYLYRHLTRFSNLRTTQF